MLARRFNHELSVGSVSALSPGVAPAKSSREHGFLSERWELRY